MPYPKVTNVTVSHVWDDGDTTDIKISTSLDQYLGPCIQLCQDDEFVYIFPESWEEIRDQIQSMMDDLE